MEVTERKRDGGIDPPSWWPRAAADAKRDRGMVNERIAVEAARAMGLDTLDVSRVTRCLNGQTATIPLMDAISTVLGIPPPVFVASTREEAAALVAASAVERRRSAALAKADAKIADLESDAANVRRQTTGVGLQHGTGDRSASPGVAGRRRNARAS